ncbi:hypothetical protein BCR42DRAFT_389511 [Absidia repens]|uniref:MPN domain-containing protein n=1 Tax=Absidia repens TaxID=90262 RepID=A0A1X2IPS2_9FUNG|nr:hypothetical protein BCR42DRAFT_389511 [Absidia repens]
MSTIELHGYTLPLIHAAKYPFDQVCGLLLGIIEKETVTKVTTAVPLFHHWTTLTPMLDIALQQVEVYAKKKQLQIVGWYQANVGMDDVSLQENAIKVNNEKLGSMEKVTDALVVYDYVELQWRINRDQFKDQVKQEYLPKVYGLLNSSGYLRVVDLDDHLENISLDWLASSDLKL